MASFDRDEGPKVEPGELTPTQRALNKLSMSIEAENRDDMDRRKALINLVRNQAGEVQQAAQVISERKDTVECLKDGKKSCRSDTMKDIRKRRDGIVAGLRNRNKGPKGEQAVKDFEKLETELSSIEDGADLNDQQVNSLILFKALASYGLHEEKSIATWCSEIVEKSQQQSAEKSFVGEMAQRAADKQKAEAELANAKIAGIQYIKNAATEGAVADPATRDTQAAGVAGVLAAKTPDDVENAIAAYRASLFAKKGYYDVPPGGADKLPKSQDKRSPDNDSGMTKVLA